MNIPSSFLKLLVEHNLDLRLFIWIYIFSFIPVYVGYFLIIFDSIKGMSLRDIISLKLGKLTFGAKAIFGIVLTIFGLAMPYVYILLAARDLPTTYYLFTVLIMAGGVLYFIFRIKKSYRRTIDKDCIVHKKEIISEISEMETLWDIYNDSFIDLNKNAPCQQSFDKEHFLGILQEKTAIKYILTSKEGSMIGMGMVTNNFHNTPWISSEYFKNKFRDYYHKNLIYYFIGIAVAKEYRHQGYGTLLIKTITENLPEGAMLGFDHSANINFFIPHFSRIATKKIKKRYLDSQSYYVIS